MEQQVQQGLREASGDEKCAPGPFPCPASLICLTLLMPVALDLLPQHTSRFRGFDFLHHGDVVVPAKRTFDLLHAHNTAPSPVQLTERGPARGSKKPDSGLVFPLERPGKTFCTSQIRGTGATADSSPPGKETYDGG